MTHTLLQTLSFYGIPFQQFVPLFKLTPKLAFSSSCRPQALPGGNSSFPLIFPFPSKMNSKFCLESLVASLPYDAPTILGS